MDTQVKNLDQVLRKYIGSDLLISGVKETPLVAPGENYGSFLVKLDITLKSRSKNNYEEIIHAVAKLLPKTEFMKMMFDVQNTVKKEIVFYTIIVPKLQQFQRQCGVGDVINCFPEFYGSRLNLNGNKEVDDDAVILLENLVSSGFQTLDRLIGCDLETTKLFLKNLATFHAVPLAMKFKKPMEFKRHIKSYCINSEMPPPQEDQPPPPTDIILEILYENDGCLPYMSKIKKMFSGPPPKVEAREPFATMIHGDMWINNQMIRFEKDRPVENKIFDFQNYFYNTPCDDLLNFLFTSVQLEVLDESLNYLLKYYHECFISNLHQLDCDTTAFAWPHFQEELRSASEAAIQRAIFFTLFIVYGKRDRSGEASTPDFLVSNKDVSLKAKEKLWYILHESGRRNWL